MLTFYGVGMILGAGIYSIIGKAAGISGEGVWQGFILAAISAMLTALSYAELSSMFPRAGGEYIYIREAFSKHRWLATAAGVMMIFAGCATAATVALAFSNYLQYFFEAPQFTVAMVLLILGATLNMIGIQESSRVNVVFTIIEVSGLIIFIWLGLQNPKFGEALSAAPNASTLASAALIIFAYFGFENIVNLAEEAKNPEKSVPKAIFASLCISTILYILVSLAAVALMSPDELAKSEKALSDAAATHSSTIAGVLGGIALFSTANTALIALVATSRILYGIAKDKSLPSVLAKTLPKRKTPWVAAIVCLIVALSLLPLGQVEVVASVSSFATMLAFLIVNIALIVLRFSQPEQTRPFRIPLAIGKLPIFPCLAALLCLIFLFQFKSQIYLLGLATFVVSIGIYLLSKKSNDTTKAGVS